MFVATVPLRWSDLDAQGHVNNAIIVDYLQEARVAFFRSGPTSDLLDSGIVVVSHQVEYRSPGEYVDGAVRVEIVVASLGAARFELAYDVLQGERVVAGARTVLCPFDFGGHRPTRLDADARSFLAGHFAEVEPFRPLELASPVEGVDIVEIAVRWSDLDAYGHVNNVKLFDFLQQARIEVTKTWDPEMARSGDGDGGFMWFVARQDVDYVSQLAHRLEPYELHVAPAAVGNSSLTVTAELRDGDVVIGRGRTVLVCADATGRPTPLPDRTKSRIAELIRGAA